MSGSPPVSEFDSWGRLLDLLDVAVALLDERFFLLYRNVYWEQLISRQEIPKPGQPIYSGSNLSQKELLRINREMVSNGQWQGVITLNDRPLSARIFRFTDFASEAGDLSNVAFLITVQPAIDTTARMAEASNTAQQRDAIASQKIDILSQTSHELRTPLNAILGFAQLLAAGTDLSVEQQDYVQEINSASAYLLKLVNRLLSFSKTNHEYSDLKLAQENFRFSELVSECQSLVEPLATKAGVKIHFHGEDSPLMLDRVRLKQVMLNLLSNAIKYNRVSGEVVVRSFVAKNSVTHIEVQDTGKGIANSVIDTIFNPFERLGVKDEKVEGTGIGLMITRRLVDLMGGTVSVVSEPESGSVFSLEFPDSPATTTTLDGSGAAVVWVGQSSTASSFVQRLSQLRPGLTFLQTESVCLHDEERSEVLSTKRILVLIDASDSQSLNKAYLPNPEFMVSNHFLVSTQQDFHQYKELYPELAIGNLRIPISPVEFLSLVDRHLAG